MGLLQLGFVSLARCLSKHLDYVPLTSLSETYRCLIHPPHCQQEQYTYRQHHLTLRIFRRALTARYTRTPARRWKEQVPSRQTSQSFSSSATPKCDPTDRVSSSSSGEQGNQVARYGLVSKPELKIFDLTRGEKGRACLLGKHGMMAAVYDVALSTRKAAKGE